MTVAIPRGYTTKAAVAAYLGATFSAGQNTQCDALIIRAESRIDRMTRRAWLTGALTDEICTVRKNADLLGQVFTQNYPIATVQGVKVRSIAFDATDTTLTLNSTTDGYQVRDLDTGLILMPGSYKGYICRVSYTAVGTLPDDLALAVEQLVSHWMQAALQPDTQNIQSYSVGQDLSVTYRSTAGYSIPSDVETVIMSYADRRPG